MDKAPKKNQSITNNTVSSPWQRRPITLYDRLLKNRAMRAPLPLRQRGDMEGQFQINDLAVNTKQNSFTEESSTAKMLRKAHAT